MLTVVKISITALVATVVPPTGLRELASMPSEPSAASRDAPAAADAKDHSRQFGVLPDLRALQASAEVANNQANSRERRAVDGSALAPALPAKLALQIGDNLKIGFFETIDMGSDRPSGQKGAGPQGVLRTFYQRMDLSGDYTVEQDGAISIPLLGRFQVEGRALDDVRADLMASFTNVIGRNANIDVRILERAPIYVVGPVKNPGAYKYVPGMIVLHAIALAGGLDRGGENLSGMIEGAREMERLRIATLELDQLRARRARLVAERDEVSMPPILSEEASASPTPGDGDSALAIPVQVTELARERTAGFLATESTILLADQATRRQQDQEIATKVAAVRDEVKALKLRLDQFDVQKNMRVDRLDTLQKLKDRGVVTTFNVLLIRTELADIEAHRQESIVAVVQAQTRLAEAEGSGARLSSQKTADIAKEIETVDKEIADAQEAKISAGALTTILLKPGSGTLQSASYEIVRQSKDGAGSLQATETSPLMPGDVLKINLNAAGINLPSVHTPPPPSNTHAAN